MNPRIKWLRNQLIPLKLDGMIVANPINIRYLTGLSEEGTLNITVKQENFSEEDVVKIMEIAQEQIKISANNIKVVEIK